MPDLKVLHRLLVEDEARRQRREEQRERLRPMLEEAKVLVDRALEAAGVIDPTPSQDDGTPPPPRWRRPVDPSLLTVPYVPAQTTLVPLSSIPIPNRAGQELGEDEDGDKDRVVEVPTSALLSPEAAAGGGGALSRPLQGNLSTKLADYTRGQVGRRQSFRAGGIDADDLAIEEDGGDGAEASVAEAESEFLSEEACRAAMEVLEKGSLRAWRDGTLITAPPGVGFDVGIGPGDVDLDVEVYGEKGCEREAQEERAAGGASSKAEPERTAAAAAGREAVPAASLLVNADGIWDKQIFDDDSLFAESSSDSDEDSSEEGDASEEGGEDQVPSDEEEEKMEDDAVARVEALEGDFSEENLDALLEELTLSTRSEAEKIFSKTKGKVQTNPALKAKDDKSAKGAAVRKSWAVTEPLPIGDFNSLVPNPAIKYPFELDDFQKQAVARLERSECIFVAAHTSAGKTVCAEYAIALARKHCTRAIYTSPIKALSNQKYRDFRDKFGEDVGLITGDMQIGADSSCLIMTTEILRSMLYRGADLVRDIEWVIFDEVHYINDSERGVVWEEVIIMLPDYVNLIFLSATTPNTIEFSDWIGRTKRKPVHVIRTNYRPVPLSHHLWAGLKLHKIMEGKSGFVDKGYSDAAKALLPRGSAKDGDKSGAGAKVGSGGAKQSSSASQRVKRGSRYSAWQQQGNKGQWMSLVKYLDREALTPTVIFSFSKRKCEEIANMLRSLTLNTASERNAVHMFAAQTIARLSPNDASLPQVLQTCDMVTRGIGIHHGGLLPILKEMVEILFSRNLIKVLFATETFSMGVNLPVKAVVFNSIRKHDGTQFRVLQPGEYTQMAGRAGRRGLDKVGTVILCCFGDQPPPQVTLKNLLTGTSTKLESQFRLTFNMILNLLRVEDMSVEGMIKRSFSEFATQRALTNEDYPKLLSRGIKGLAKLEKRWEQEADARIGAEDIGEYFSTSSELIGQNREILSQLLSAAGGAAGGALVPGRILLVTSAKKQGYVRTPAMVVKSPDATAIASKGKTPGTSSTRLQSAVCIVLMPESYIPPQNDGADAKSKIQSLNYIGSSKHRYYAIHEVGIGDIVLVSSTKQKIDSKALFKDDIKGKQSRSGGKLDPFARATAVGSRQLDDDPFAGMMARGKNKKGSAASSSSNTVSSEQSQIDEVVLKLIDAEQLERNSSFGIMDLRDCTKGTHQGNDVFKFRSACDRVEDLVLIMRSFQSHTHPSLERHYAAVERKETLRATVSTLRHSLSNESLALFPDFLQRKALLRTLGYVDQSDTVCVKGRVACEVNTCEELIVTEMVFEGVLNDLEPAEIVAALSALIFQEKTGDFEPDAELPESLVDCWKKMNTIATNLGTMQRDHGLHIDPQEYCENSLKFGLVHVVYEWALGVPFSSICELTLVQEGSIVRTITRLDELCREVRNCARVLGNPTLYRKMEAASVAIKRDIVFASSLYVS